MTTFRGFLSNTVKLLKIVCFLKHNKFKFVPQQMSFIVTYSALTFTRVIRLVLWTMCLCLEISFLVSFLDNNTRISSSSSLKHHYTSSDLNTLLQNSNVQITFQAYFFFVFSSFKIHFVSLQSDDKYDTNMNMIDLIGTIWLIVASTLKLQWWLDDACETRAFGM